MPIEDAARGFRRPTPAALLIANACFSAHVDLRGVGADVSVLSGSTGAIAAAGTTPIARTLTDVLKRPLDCDGDQLASDFEIFSPLQREISFGGGSPNPKLLRQLSRMPAFFQSTHGECPLVSPPIDGSAAESFPAGRRHLRFPGRVPDGPSAPGGFVDPCSEPVGQCFDVSPRPPS